MGTTTIEWTDRTWNPVRGCSLVSEGCRNCYAMKQAHRHSGEGRPFAGLTEIGSHGPRWTGEVRVVPDALFLPLRWKQRVRVFVNSMSDLFHEDLDDHDIDKVFAVMLISHLHETRGGHTFQVLTKRAERMAAYFQDPDQLRKRWATVGGSMMEDGDAWHDSLYFLEGPLLPPSIWLGVSVEHQEAADQRIHHLLRTPAAVRFVSCEPLLGPVDLGDALGEQGYESDGPAGWIQSREHGIDWVICGGESGPGARPMHPAWARGLRDQCAEASVPFFFKQWGAWGAIDEPWKQDSPAKLGPRERWLNAAGGSGFHGDEVWRMRSLGKGKAGRLLDGKLHDAFPVQASA